MAARCPKQVTIGGRTIAVRVDPSLEAWGEYRADDWEIVLSARATAKASTLRETLRHEMLHAALDISGLAYIQKFEEEAIVRCVDTIFHPAWDEVRKTLTP